MVVMVGRGISLYVWRWVEESIWRGQVRIRVYGGGGGGLRNVSGGDKLGLEFMVVHGGYGRERD